MAKFRKRPVVIEAVRWDGSNDSLAEIVLLAEGMEPRPFVDRGNQLVIETPEGEMRASVGCWVIRGVAGEIYPCRSDIFEETYEKVGE